MKIYICGGKITLQKADKDQSDLADEINKLIKKTKLKNSEKKQEKEIAKENLRNFFQCKENDP